MKNIKKILIFLLLTVLLADIVVKMVDQIIPEMSSLLSIIIIVALALVLVLCLIWMWKFSEINIPLKAAITAYVAIHISEMAIDRYLLPKMTGWIKLSVALTVLRIILILLIFMLTFSPNKEKTDKNKNNVNI